MSSIRFLKIAAIVALAAGCVQAQSVLVSLWTPSSKVLVGGAAQVTAAITAIDGTPLDSGRLNWSSSDTTVASVSSAGLVTGLAPGDTQIGVTDSQTGAGVVTILHVVPSAMSLRASSPTVTAGDTVQLSASALDASGNAIPNLHFQFRSGQTSVATVSADGIVTGVSEGTVSIEAAVAGVASNPALVAAAQIHVLAKPRYKIRKVISTDVVAPTTIAAVAGVSANSSSAIGTIVTLANGGQAALLIEGAKTTVIAAAGQQLPATGRLVLRIDGISTNSRGDVALWIEYPSQWCAASVFLFPHGQPEIELGAANCYNGFSSHSLSDDGVVIYHLNDQILSATAASPPVTLFSLGAQSGVKDPLRSIDSFSAGAGAFMVGGTLASGAQGFFWSDGKAFTPVYRSGDLIHNTPSNGLDVPVGGPGGVFYTRANLPNNEALVQVNGSGITTLALTGDNTPTGKIGWIDYVLDAGPAGVLFVGDFAAPNNYHTSVGLWKSGATVEVTPLAGYSAAIAGALPSDGVPLVCAALKADNSIPGLRALVAAGDPQLVLKSGSAFPKPAPSGIEWHFASRGGAAGSLPVRAAGEAVVVVDTAVHTVAVIGAPLPNGKIATWIGAANANTAGDLVFTAGYATGSVLLRYHGGQLETLSDTGVTGITALASVSWFNSFRGGRYLATNNHGDTAHASQFLNGAIQQIVMLAAGVPKFVAAQNVAGPGGVIFRNFNNLAVDDKGRVLFVATTSDGRQGVYFWDGNTVQRVIGVGDKISSGTVNEISNISNGGQGFIILLAVDNYRARELRYFDGQMRTIESSDTSLLDGAWLNYFWMNEATLSTNGDAHYQAQTQDGSVGVYARLADGSLAVVARSRDPLPGGEWLIFPLTVSSAAQGEVYFTAYTWNNGVESLALYLATPQ